MTFALQTMSWESLPQEISHIARRFPESGNTDSEIINSAVAISTKYVYMLRIAITPMEDLILNTINLSDGEWKKSSTVPPMELPITAFGVLKMVVSADDAFIAVKTANLLLCMLNAATGEIMKSYDLYEIEYFEDSYDASWILPEPDSSDFLEICWRRGYIEVIYYYKFEAHNKRFTREPLMVNPRGCLTACGGVDYHRR